MSNPFSSKQELQSYRKTVALMLLASAVAASALFLPIRREAIELYDEGSYYAAAADIREHGPLAKFHTANLHSYLFPSVLAYGIPPWLDISKKSGRTAVFGLQSVLFFITALSIGRAIRPAFGPRRSLAIVAMFCFNPFILIYLGYSLTDSFSLVLTVAFLTATAVSFQAERALSVKAACIAGFLFGGAIMTRPANIYLLSLAVPALVLHLYQGIRSGRTRQTAIACALAILAAAIVCIPESLNRYRNFGELSPLIIQSGKDQFSSARRNLKYATYDGPGAPPWVNYRNPFYPETSLEPVPAFLQMRAWILSTLTKMFGLVDQDFMRPYIYTFTSPDRWIGTVLSLALFMAGAIGLSQQSWSATKALWRARFRRLESGQAFALASLLTVAGCFGLYSQTTVESRFGLPIVAIVPLFVPFALSWWRQLNSLWKAMAAAWLAAFVAAGCALSHWIQSLSESIVHAWGTTF